MSNWLTSRKPGRDPKWMKFSRCKTDYSLYHYHHKGVTIFVGCYVDDLVIVSNNLDAVKEFKRPSVSKSPTWEICSGYWAWR